MATEDNDHERSAERSPERTYSIEEASRATGISVSTLRRLVKAGRLAADKTHPKRYAIAERDLPRRAQAQPRTFIANAQGTFAISDLEARLSALERSVDDLRALVLARRGASNVQRTVSEWAGERSVEEGASLSERSERSLSDAYTHLARTPVPSMPLASAATPLRDGVRKAQIVLEDVAIFLTRHGVKSKSTARGWGEQRGMPRDDYTAALGWAVQFCATHRVGTRLRKCYAGGCVVCSQFPDEQLPPPLDQATIHDFTVNDQANVQ